MAVRHLTALNTASYVTYNLVSWETHIDERNNMFLSQSRQLSVRSNFSSGILLFMRRGLGISLRPVLGCVIERISVGEVVLCYLRVLRITGDWLAKK